MNDTPPVDVRARHGVVDVSQVSFLSGKSARHKNAGRIPVKELSLYCGDSGQNSLITNHIPGREMRRGPF